MTAPTFEKLQHPKQGTRVTVDERGTWHIPDDPIVCLLRGDGIGRDIGNVPGITTCAVKVLAGTPDHRDNALSEEERAEKMCICVSRASGDTLELDL